MAITTIGEEAEIIFWGIFIKTDTDDVINVKCPRAISKYYFGIFGTIFEIV
jgi:hypothetical protein